MKASAFRCERMNGRFFASRFYQLPQWISFAPALQKCDAYILVRVVKNLIIPIGLQHVSKALHGVRNRRHNESHMVECSVRLPGQGDCGHLEGSRRLTPERPKLRHDARYLKKFV